MFAADLKVGDAPRGGGGDALDVLVECVTGSLERCLRALTLLPLVVADVERVDGALLGVNLDDVAILHEADGTANLRLGGDVSDHEAVGTAGEAAVGDERAVVAEAGAHDGGGGGEHLGIPGPPLGPS